jgi:hypothetical protein
MTLKDHATGLTYLTALPRKQAHLVTYKLQEVFGVIGYHKIFHSDNGKEFTAKCVLELLHHLNPNIISVTGRPRRPCDQEGSVENVNKLVKKVLGTVLSERKTEGQNPNWTTVLGSVAAAINSQCGRGKNSVTAFEAVFRQKMDHPLSCSKAEARRCWTIKERIMLVANEPDFDSYCRENYIIDDDDVYNGNEVTDKDGDHEDNDGYFSEDELPLDEMDEVDDDYFYEHLMDNTATITLSMTSRKKKEKKEEVVEPPSSVMDVKTNNLSGKNMGENKSFNKVVAADEVMDIKKRALSPDSDVINVKEEDIKKKAPRTLRSKKGKGKGKGNSKAKSPSSDSSSPEVTDAWDIR